MDEFNPPETATAPPSGRPRVPISAYLMAVISGVFVAFGIMFLAAFSHLFVGDLLVRAPKPVLTAIPWLAIGLGLLTAWQTIRKERGKAIAKARVGNP